MRIQAKIVRAATNCDFLHPPLSLSESKRSAICGHKYSWEGCWSAALSRGACYQGELPEGSSSPGLRFYCSSAVFRRMEIASARPILSSPSTSAGRKTSPGSRRVRFVPHCLRAALVTTFRLAPTPCWCKRPLRATDGFRERCWGIPPGPRPLRRARRTRLRGCAAPPA